MGKGRSLSKNSNLSIQKEESLEVTGFFKEEAALTVADPLKV
jgi:hypothetical protein